MHRYNLNLPAGHSPKQKNIKNHFHALLLSRVFINFGGLSNYLSVYLVRSICRVIVIICGLRFLYISNDFWGLRKVVDMSYIDFTWAIVVFLGYHCRVYFLIEKYFMAWFNYFSYFQHSATPIVIKLVFLFQSTVICLDYASILDSFLLSWPMNSSLILIYCMISYFRTFIALISFLNYFTLILTLNDSVTDLLTYLCTCLLFSSGLSSGCPGMGSNFSKAFIHFKICNQVQWCYDLQWFACFWIKYPQSLLTYFSLIIYQKIYFSYYAYGLMDQQQNEQMIELKLIYSGRVYSRSRILWQNHILELWHSGSSMPKALRHKSPTPYDIFFREIQPSYICITNYITLASIFSSYAFKSVISSF